MDHRFKLNLHQDGRLVLHSPDGLSWSLSPPNDSESHHAQMQDDGNFVLRDKDGAVLFETATQGKGSATTHVVMQNNGELVIYSYDVEDGLYKSVWSRKDGLKTLRNTDNVPTAEPTFEVSLEEYRSFTNADPVDDVKILASMKRSNLSAVKQSYEFDLSYQKTHVLAHSLDDGLKVRADMSM